MESKHGATGHMMSKMDADGDSMVSKEEFMKAHEAMLDQMKGKNGMISLKDIAARHENRKDHGHMGFGKK